MPAVEKIRELYPDPVPPQREARERARLALATRVERPSRRWVALPAVGIAVAVGVAAIALIGLGDEASIDARAAALLRDAASKVKAQPLVGAGEVLYVRSTDGYLASTPEQGWSVLVPHTRVIWLRPDGSGRLRTTTGTPRFLSERDRANWIAAGRPSLSAGASKEFPISPAAGSDLPSDPDALFDRLKERSEGHSKGTYREMFTLVGDAFRETNLDSAQRAALYEVVARIPGVELVGPLKDPVGRPGVAVAVDHPSDGIRHTLVIDPETGTMLSEEEVTLEKNSWGYPAGTVIGHSTYLVTAMVKAVGGRPG